LHQDVVVPNGWDKMAMQQLSLAELRFGPIGVAGVYGVGPVIERAGQLHCDRRHPVSFRSPARNRSTVERSKAVEDTQFSPGLKQARLNGGT
jgi:hypothetical protein